MRRATGIKPTQSGITRLWKEQSTHFGVNVVQPELKKKIIICVSKLEKESDALQFGFVHWRKTIYFTKIDYKNVYVHVCPLLNMNKLKEATNIIFMSYCAGAAC